MDEKKYKLICVRKGKTNYARTNNRKNVTLGSYTREITLLVYKENQVFGHLLIQNVSASAVFWPKVRHIHLCNSEFAMGH